jgi:hypothetical protein
MVEAEDVPVDLTLDPDAVIEAFKVSEMLPGHAAVCRNGRSQPEAAQSRPIFSETILVPDTKKVAGILN